MLKIVSIALAFAVLFAAEAKLQPKSSGAESLHLQLSSQSAARVSRPAYLTAATNARPVPDQSLVKRVSDLKSVLPVSALSALSPAVNCNATWIDARQEIKITGDVRIIEGLEENHCQVCAYQQAADQEIQQLEHDAKLFMFHVCNRSKWKAFVAVSGRKNPDSSEWTVTGWWNISPGDCTDIGPFARGWFYYMWRLRHNTGNV